MLILPKPKNLESGQTVLVILLVMTVMLTVGLSLASRSITDVKISQQSQEGARAFWVAQAGLEKAIKANAGESGSLNSINYLVSRTGLGGGKDFVFPEPKKADDPVTLWLVGHTDPGGLIDESSSYKGKLTLYWGNPGEAVSEASPALEAILIYKDAGGNFRSRRYAYDPYPNRPTKTNFAEIEVHGNMIIAGQAFAFASPENDIDLNKIGTPYLLRLRLLFNSTLAPIGVSATLDLPNQGFCFDSSATVLESGITQRLKECPLWQFSPQIFDFTLFTGGGIN